MVAEATTDALHLRAIGAGGDVIDDFTLVRER
jgi:hypothetical protein